MKTSTKLSIAAAAMTGLLAGASQSMAFSTVTSSPVSTISAASNAGVTAAVDSRFGAKAFGRTVEAHDCKGKNACKGQGGCAGGDAGCKGKNSCKGKGGCKTDSLSAKAASAALLGTLAARNVAAAHDCKGQNACKGQGGCKTDSNACKGQNACKGKGGCKTNSL